MATIKEVAELAKVSTATVSYVLNGTGTVTEATRQRVLDAVTALNYQPNYAARSLRSRSHTLGVVLPVLSARLCDPVLAELLSGFSEAAAAQGYYLLLATASVGQDEAQLAEQLVRTGRLDGVALLDMQTDDERVRYLSEKCIPHVCAGSPPSDLDSSFVTLDDHGGAASAVRHLLHLGHRRIGLIMLPSDLAASDPRYQGYVDALSATRIEIDPMLAVEAGRAQSDGLAAMQELLDLPQPPTAVVACSDELAFGAMHALQNAGLEAGRDVSLVGFDDVPMAAYTHPPLTTLHYSRHTMGIHLAQLLIGVVEERQPPQPNVTLAMHLMIRKSTMPLSKQTNSFQSAVFAK
ncbi:MAG: LacI family transcriptional regulator [Chloroflexales bacterium]|nr:LacI family transcriptional regulator [Chloroflexales bacterium]